jgi:hypothetical protein
VTNSRTYRTQGKPRARERIAAERAARKRAEARRRLLLAIGAVPFLDIGNRYVLAGAQYDPQVLGGLSAAQIAARLRNPSSPVAQAIDGSAKVIVAAINQILHDQAGQG